MKDKNLDPSALGVRKKVGKVFHVDLEVRHVHADGVGDLVLLGELEQPLDGAGNDSLGHVRMDAAGRSHCKGLSRSCLPIRKNRSVVPLETSLEQRFEGAFKDIHLDCEWAMQKEVT